MSTIVDFEHGPYYEDLWGGNIFEYEINGTLVKSGDYSLYGYEDTIGEIPGSFATRSFIVDRGSPPIEADVYLETQSDRAGITFACQSESEWSGMSCYGVMADVVNSRVEIIRVDGGDVTVLEETNELYSDWTTMSVDSWGSDGDITASVGSTTLSTTDSTYTGGGIGVFCDGDEVALDTVTASSYTDTRPGAPSNASITRT